MEYIRQEDEAAYRWLMRYDPEKWTLHADGGRRWGTLTTNVLESFNGLCVSNADPPGLAAVSGQPTLQIDGYNPARRPQDRRHNPTSAVLFNRLCVVQ